MRTFAFGHDRDDRKQDLKRDRDADGKRRDQEERVRAAGSKFQKDGAKDQAMICGDPGATL